MADLKVEGASLAKGAGGVRRASDPIGKPLAAFTSASHDLSALGALGSLLKATGEVRDGMHTLGKAAEALQEEWSGQAEAMDDVADAFELLDLLLKKAAAGGK